MVRRTTKPSTRRARDLSFWTIVGRWLPCMLALVGGSGCGGDPSDEEPEARKPDTGYGKEQPPPTVRSCAELCARLGDCAAQLCNEDTKSTRYNALEDILTFQCESMCSEPQLASEFTEAQWQCLFVDSCRQALDYDDCHAKSSYSCN